MVICQNIFAGISSFALLFLLFGCTAALSDDKALSEFTELKKEYSAEFSLPTNNILLNDYISALSLLRGKSGGGIAKVLDAELFSARTFFHLNEVFSVSSGINAGTMQCSSKEVKSIISSLDLAKNNQVNAIGAINALSSEEAKHLRNGQLDSVVSYGETIAQFEVFFKDRC